MGASADDILQLSSEVIQDLLKEGASLIDTYLEHQVAEANALADLIHLSALFDPFHDLLIEYLYKHRYKHQDLRSGKKDVLLHSLQALVDKDRHTVIICHQYCYIQAKCMMERKHSARGISFRVKQAGRAVDL